MSSTTQDQPEKEKKPLQGLEIAGTFSFEVLSRDLEYPPCPSCEKNNGLFTQVSENTDELHCVMCGHRFGSIHEVVTTRELPRPIRDDFVACIAGDVEAEEQAKHRGIDVHQVLQNVERADELLSRDWVTEWRKENLEVL